MIQCKDIPDLPILEFLRGVREADPWRLATWNGEAGNNVRRAMPEGVNDKLVLAKMEMLIRRGLVEGCSCGCRGDFFITSKGLDFISKAAA